MNQPISPAQPSRLQRIKEGNIETLPTQEEHRVVNIERLIENPENERKTFRNMDGLIATVKSSGILEPLIVEPTDEGKLMVKIGARRLRAAKAAGLTRVPVIISKPDDAPLRRRKSIISNLQREDIGPVEMAEGLQSLLDEDGGMSQTDLAQAIGKPKSWVSDMLRILTLPSELQVKVRTSELSVAHDSVITIARLTDNDQQQRLVKALLDGATVRDIRQQVGEIKGKPQQPTEPKKPKAVYSTSHDATVIVQSLTETLPHGQVIKALEEALDKARSPASR
jgi:ParB family chromosome partitioning protein